MTAQPRTLYVGGLSPDTDADILRDLFARYGEVREARVVMRPNGEHCRGFGYVTFLVDSAALRAKADLDGQVIRGSRLRVDLAR